jgi:hypothetical protein
MSRLLLAVLGGALLLPASVSAQFSFPTTEAHAPMFYPTAYKDEGARDWACGSIYYSGHGGSDFGVGGFPGMDAGRDLVAAADGTVVTALDGFFDRCTTANCPGGGGFGNYVSIDHGGGIVTYYGHMRQWSVAVSPGDTVTCGTFLGQVGSSGRSTGPHLHYDYRINGVRSDPFAGSCSGPNTAWNDQGTHGGLPGVTCTGGSSGPPPFIVDDLDPGFSFTLGSTSDVSADTGTGGYDNHFWFQSPLGSTGTIPGVQGRWQPDVPITGLYQIDAYIPLSWNAMAEAAPYDIAFQGGHAAAPFDQSPTGGIWEELFPNQPFKFVAGQRNYVSLSNVVVEPEENYVAFDAIRWTYIGPPGGGTVSQGCSWSGDCEGDLICMDGVCAQPCYVAGCTDGLDCETETGICGYGTWGEDDYEPGPYWNPDPSDDADNDGIPDYIEGMEDSDGDGFPDWLDMDSDNDGIPDSVESDGDYDHDGIPNYLDEDSDGDGVSDADEVGANPDNPTDTDGDGQPDFIDSDSDGDGVGDATEYPNGDSDGDGIPDALDPDSDNDGIDDGTEWGDDPSEAADTDGDGVPDWQDEDSDGDGLPDAWESDDDSDDDGIPDFQDEDSDNDGIPDSEDEDSDGDGVPDDIGVIDSGDDDGFPVQDCGGGCGGAPTSLGLLLLVAVPLGRRRRSVV